MLNHGYTYRDTVRQAHEGLSVIEFYSECYTDFSREEWWERISDGQIFLNGRQAHAGDTLSPGDALEYRRPPWEEPTVPQNINTLFDDEDLTIFHKPSGLQVLPGGGFLENTMLHIVRTQFDKRLSPIHRLGRGTSGAILFTKTPRAAATLSAAMRHGDIEKTYLALVQGMVSEPEFTVTQPIGLVPHPLMRKIYAAADDGKPSISRAFVLERRPDNGTTLLKVRIPTGRPHQIRIHMAYAGYPLLGDPLYGKGGLPIVGDDPSKTAVPGDTGYFLHSWKIDFTHPCSGERQTITAPPPDLLHPA